jgi:hypothetical protein
MIPAVVKSALVVLIAFLLHLGAVALGIPLEDGVLTALAIAIVSYLLGEPAGAKVQAFLAK